MQPNRIAVYLTAAAGLAGAIAVPLANLDTTSTAGVIAGLTAILVTSSTWLVGWQKHEARVDDLGDSALDPILAGLPVATDPGPLLGDAGAPRPPAGIDTRDQQIAQLQTQLAQVTAAAGTTFRSGA